jgi:hypothetical protein
LAGDGAIGTKCNVGALPGRLTLRKFLSRYLAGKIFMVSRALGISALAGTGTAQTTQPSVQQRVATLKATFAASQANLRQYEWIETTVVSLKGATTWLS